MDSREFVVSAGRAVLDVVEREWQPLSADELDQRLDQALEEMLESELMAKLSQPPPASTVYNVIQIVQSQANVGAQVLHAGTTTASLSEEHVESVDSAVKCVTDLLQGSKSRTRMAGRARLSLAQTVLLSLTLLSERVSYRSVSRRFHLEKGNIHRIFFSFCERVNVLKEKQIRWPVGGEAAEALLPLCSLEKKGVDEGRRVPRVLGVLGHTRVPTRVPLGKRDAEGRVPEAKRMRKEDDPDSWLNLELVCNRTGRFLHCRVSKGSDVDRGRFLRDRLKQHPELMPAGSCLVARAGYPLTAHILTPYAGADGLREELFNKTLEDHFHILDQAVANLKARFPRLTYLDIANHERASAVVLTACVLHNAFLDMGQFVQGQAEKEEAASPEGDVEEAGLSRRDALSHLLLESLNA